MLPPVPVQALLAGRAGLRGRPNGLADIRIITLHIQVGTNYLPDYFASISDDATLWCDRDGTLYRMLADSDTPYTNGWAYEPLDHTNPVLQRLWKEGVSNTNPYALTIECAGFANLQDALDHGIPASEAAALGRITAAQHASLVAQCWAWCVAYSLPSTAIVRHSDCGQHKFCPGSSIDVEGIRAEVEALLNPHNPPAPPPDHMFFPQTGHSIGGGFWQYWQANGGLSIFGYPLTEEFQENGQTVQYFERARFEYHPDAPLPYRVQLGRVGAELLAAHQAHPASVPVPNTTKGKVS